MESIRRIGSFFHEGQTAEAAAERMGDKDTAARNLHPGALISAFGIWYKVGLPLSTIPGGFIEMITPVWISCFIVSLLTQRPTLRAAKRICGGH